MKDTQILLMMEGVVETVKGVTTNADRLEVVIDSDSPLHKILVRQFEQGDTFDCKVLVSESYWFAVCNFSAQVNNIGISEYEVYVGLIVMTNPVWKRVSKQIWNRKKGT